MSNTKLALNACSTVASVSALLPRDSNHDLASSEELQDSAIMLNELPQEKLCTALPPLIAPEEVKMLLTDLRERQEQRFEEVLGEQRTVQNQLAAIESAIKGFMTEFSNFSSKSPGEYLVGKTDQTSSCVDIDEILRGHSAAVLSEPSADEPERKEKFEAYMTAETNNEEVKKESNETNPIDTCGQNVALRRSRSVDLARSDSALRRSLTSQYGNGGVHHGILKRIDKVLHSKNFDIAISILILMNAFIMCWECQYAGLDVGFNLQYPGRRVEAHVVWEGADTVFTCFDWFFGIFFLVEMIVKLVCWRQHYFYMMPKAPTQTYFNVADGAKTTSLNLPCLHFLYGIQAWNLLDGLSVVAFLFIKLATVGFINPQMLRSLRLFRLGRLVRLLRFLEGLDHLYVMTTAISGLKKILQVTYFDQVKAGDLTEDELLKHHQMYEYFGTCTRCMLSMFEITLGNWPPIARLLSEEVSEWFTLICLAHKLTIGFAVVGVITGCILQETFKVAQTDDIILFRQKKMAAQVLNRKMTALFETLDVSKDKQLNVEEFEAINTLPEVKTWLSSLDIETDDLRMLFYLCDIDGDGSVSLDELLERMPRIKGNARSIDVLAMQKQLWKNSPKPASAKVHVLPEEDSSLVDCYV